ncbi:MAG: hypothetical protein LBV19_05200 [Streptococcaceae bacterium]|jgi:hypothetical protein|nr:hypothetical protein [Streptococcaceae bacterium]
MNEEEIEKLVEIVVDEVMRRLTIQSASVEYNDEEKDDSSNGLVVAMDPDQSKYSAANLEVLNHYSQNTEWQNSCEKSDLLILSWLNFNRMTYVANLQQMDTLTELILSFLLKKKPILLLAWEYKLTDIKKTSRFGLWRRYDEILSTLEGYGIQFIRSEKHLNIVLEKEAKKKQAAF